MSIELLPRGVLLGFSIAAPVGPIGVLCIRRTLAHGRAYGFVSGLGAATADMCYGAVAAFGLAFVSGFLIGEQVWIRLIGGLFLGYLGMKTLRAQPSSGTADAPARGFAAAYASTLLLTLTNPATILSFVAIFAGLGVATAASAAGAYASAGLLVAGVFLGSALWWLLLSTVVSRVRARFTPRWMRRVNLLSGAILLGFGVVALLGVRPG